MKMEKLPVEFKEIWIAALRSGKYKQGKETLLTNTGKMCCLGVACIVANEPMEDKIGDASIPYSNTNPEIPDIIKGPGLKDTIIGTLMNMNDDKKKSFNEIADWIEVNL